MKLERKFYELQFTELEIRMLLEALEEYSMTSEEIKGNPFPEPKRLAEEIKRIKEKQDAK